MKLFYVCIQCNSLFSNDYLEEHNLSVCPMEFQSEQFCYGELKPAFLASDIEKLINGRIEQHKKNILESDQCIHMDYIQAEMLQCMALEKLLSALEVGEHE